MSHPEKPTFVFYDRNQRRTPRLLVSHAKMLRSKLFRDRPYLRAWEEIGEKREKRKKLDEITSPSVEEHKMDIDSDNYSDSDSDSDEYGLYEKGYNVLHKMYEIQKSKIDRLKEQIRHIDNIDLLSDLEEKLEREEEVFIPIQKAFLRNREKKIPTEVYQLTAQYLDRESRMKLSEVDKHKQEVIYGPNSGGLLWRDGGKDVLEKPYKRGDSLEELTPLMHACKDNSVKAVRSLIQGKANLETPDSKGNTPLHIACQNDNEDIVRLLVENGADVNAVVKKINQQHVKPLYYTYGVHNNIRKILLDAGASPRIGYRLSLEETINFDDQRKKRVEFLLHLNSNNV